MMSSSSASASANASAAGEATPSTDTTTSTTPTGPNSSTSSGSTSGGSTNAASQLFAKTATSMSLFGKKLVDSTTKGSKTFLESTKQNSQKVLETSKTAFTKTGQRMSLQTQKMGQAVTQSTAPLRHAMDEGTAKTKTAIATGLQQLGAVVQPKPKEVVQVQVEDLQEGMQKLLAMIESIDPPHIKWELQTTPFLNGATKEDLYKAFLNWAKEDVQEIVLMAAPDSDTADTTTANQEEGEGETTPSDNNNNTTELLGAPTVSTKVTKSVYNVTKAFVRLDAYVTWMEAHRGELAMPALTSDSVAAARRAWGMEGRHDSEGRFVWCLDYATIQYDQVQKQGGSIPLRDSLRYIVYASHEVMFDKVGTAGANDVGTTTTENDGMILVQSMGHKGLIETTMNKVLLDMSHTMDKFTMGVMPIKLKQVYMINAGRWMPFMLGLMTPFLDPKLRHRILFLDQPKVQEQLGMTQPPPGQTPWQYLETVLGADCLPPGFGDNPGTSNLTPPPESTVDTEADTETNTETGNTPSTITFTKEEEEEESTPTTKPEEAGVESEFSIL